MNDLRDISNLTTNVPASCLFSRRFVSPLPSRLRSHTDSMIATGRDSTDFEDERAPSQSVYVETPFVHGTIYPFRLSSMARQTTRSLRPPYYSAMARQTNKTRIADADDGQLILIVQAYRHLCVLDLKGQQNADGRYNPVLLKRINLFRGGFPLYMGILKLKTNKIFMFGGSYDQGFDAMNRKKCEPCVYKLYPGSWSLEYTKDLDNTKAPKTDPWVARVDNKILVVEGRNRVKSVAKPFIEYYDLNSNAWKEFPAVPIERADKKLFIGGHDQCLFLLVGYRIYFTYLVMGLEIFFCLNTRTEEWEDKRASNMRKSFQKLDIFFPRQGTCVSKVAGLDDDKNVILYHIGDIIYAYLIDDFGSLLCYQELTDELCRGITPVHDNRILFLDPKSGGRMCMVSIVQLDSAVKSGQYANSSIHIRHFELKFTGVEGFINKNSFDDEDGELSFVNVEILEDQLCTIPGVNRPELGLVDLVLLSNLMIR